MTEENLNIVSNLKDISSKKSNYQANSEYERTSSIKQIQRDKILRFILDNSDINPRYLGLPGKYWLLERELANIYPNSNITGVEKNYEIFNKSCAYIPGHGFQRRQVYPWAIDSRLESIYRRKSSASAVEIARTYTSYLINADLKSLTDKKIIEKSRDRAFYKNRLTNRNSIWYDFTSSFSLDIYLTIYNINNVISRKCQSQICITLQYGRDTLFNGTGEAARVEIIKKALPDFNCHDVWIYKGLNDVPMINICGIIPPSD